MLHCRHHWRQSEHRCQIRGCARPIPRLTLRWWFSALLLRSLALCANLSGYWQSCVHRRLAPSRKVRQQVFEQLLSKSFPVFLFAADSLVRLVNHSKPQHVQVSEYGLFSFPYLANLIRIILPLFSPRSFLFYKKDGIVPRTPPSTRDVICRIAGLGGFLGRKATANRG